MGSADEGLKVWFVPDRVEVRAVPGHLAAAVPYVDRLAKVLDGLGPWPARLSQHAVLKKR